ncbi:MAG: hypothetical protein Q8R92_05475 [Deltaproteobacteria bacterium]|nr:hypothetical protein [Deltaproteobacteria bacterium]
MSKFQVSRPVLSVVLFLTLLLSGLPTAVSALTPEIEPTAASALTPEIEPPDADARVARVLGDALYLGARDERWRYAEQNFPVERGDTYVTGASGELTLDFRGGVLVDLDHGTRLEVTNAARGPQLRLHHGAIYIVLLNPRTAYERVRVAWEGGSLLLGDRGSYRLDRFADGVVRAMVLRGRARVRAGGGGRHLDPGEAILIGTGGFASRETSYRPGDYDPFDRQVIDRYTGVFGYRPPRHFPHVIVGLWDLDTRGTWVYVPAWRTYGWKPRDAGRGWAPFRAGQWRRMPGGGPWTWIPTESWGHTTSHYGAWAYLAGHGWIWKPGRTYSPGRVGWIRSGNYIGWAPLGPSGKPVGPDGAKSPFVFLPAGVLRAGQAASPVDDQPVPENAQVEDSPDEFLASLPEDAGAPSADTGDGKADEAAGAAAAAGLEAAGERGEAVLQSAGEAGVTLPPEPEIPPTLDEAALDEEMVDDIEEMEEGAAGTSPPVSGEGPGEMPAVDPASPEDPSGEGAPEVGTPAEEGSEAAPAEGATTEEAPVTAPAVEETGDAPKAAADGERQRRRSENAAKKALGRAERDAARRQKGPGGSGIGSPGGTSPAGGAGEPAQEDGGASNPPPSDGGALVD